MEKEKLLGELKKRLKETEKKVEKEKPINEKIQPYQKRNSANFQRLPLWNDFCFKKYI